jgi:hypothetical protein
MGNKYMKFSLTQLVKDIELNDFKVDCIELGIEAKRIKISLEGAYWFNDRNSKPVVLEKGGVILIKDYSSFEARYFCPKDKLWRTLDYKSLEVIDEINEKSYADGVLKLAGIGKYSGNWIEYLIKSGDYEIYFNK